VQCSTAAGTSVGAEEVTSDFELLVTAVGEETELGDGRKHLRAVVGVVRDDLASQRASAT